MNSISRKTAKQKIVILFTIIGLSQLFLTTNLIKASTIELQTMLPNSKNRHLSQYNYFLGSWNIKMEMRNQEGKFVVLPNKAFMKAFFHEDGHTLQSIFTTDNGTYSTDLRTYSKENDNWRILFLNAEKQRWVDSEAKLIDGKMTTIIKNGYSGKEKFDVKTIQRPVDDNQFISDVYYSFDQGDSWIHVYIMTYNRLKE